MRTPLPNGKAIDKDYNPFAQKCCCICGLATGEADSWLLCSRSPEGQEYAISHPRDGFSDGDHAYVVPIGSSCLKKHQEIRHALVGESTPPEALRNEWRPIATAPRDGTLILLLIGPDDAREHPLEDTADGSRTIGQNNFDNDGEDRWQFAGWCWEHDHYSEGQGTPTHWQPAPSVPSPRGK